MRNLKPFKVYETMVYDEDFNEYIVKNMLSDDKKKSQLWHLIADLVYVLKSEHLLDLLADLKRNLMNDTRDNALKIALNASNELSAKSHNADDIHDQLMMLKDERNLKNRIKIRVMNALQAENLKDLLEKKPWNNSVKIEGHSLLVDLKNNTIEQIKSLLSHLPFEATVV